MRWWVAALVLCLPAITHAEPVISLPLDGYYRPGKFFPVKIESDRDVIVRVDADGISCTGHGRAMVLPVMSVSRVPGMVKVTIDGKTSELAIRPLEPGQRLIAYAAGVDRPTTRSADVEVTVSVGEWTQAYESADQIVTSKGVFNVDPPRGPTSSLDSAAAYDIAGALTPGRSLVQRRNVWLFAALFAIVAVGLSLARWRFTAVTLAVVAIGWVIGSGAYYASRPAVTSFAGQIAFPDQTLEHVWVFRTAVTETEDSFNVQGFVRPLLTSSPIKMWIQWNAKDWTFHYTLPAGGKMGVVYSPAGAASFSPAEDVDTEIFRDIAKRYYVRTGETVRDVDGVTIVEKK